MLSEFRRDAVLVDVMMPAMDGYELTRRIRRTPGYQDTPVIMISALDGPNHVEQVARAGATHSLVKPIDLDALWSLLDEVDCLDRP